MIEDAQKEYPGAHPRAKEISELKSKIDALFFDLKVTQENLAELLKELEKTITAPYF